ncbi:sulfurtransferase [Spongiimicrobium salis]|uniref:sulfurtransferase n=1 Tax=Spongiimicrobium salis TaxID=1667022 RepID=UPI00374D707E
MDPIVSSEWLKANIDNPNLILLEAQLNANPAASLATSGIQEIKNTRVFDLKNDFCDTTSSFPNTLPSAAQFEANCRALGINKSSIIVVYDRKGIYISPRVWWLFRTMGHSAVYVLNGGFPDWEQQGFTTENRTDRTYPLGDFKSSFQPDNWVDFDFVKTNTQTQDNLVIDARSADRFQGIASEPRKGLRSGHIPHSLNLPYTTVLENGKYKSKPELKSLLNPMITAGKKLIFSCGSGITACIILLAFELINADTKAVYDGSWTEWAQRSED